MSALPVVIQQSMSITEFDVFGDLEHALIMPQIAHLSNRQQRLRERGPVKRGKHSMALTERRYSK
jgi:hypothetical protein